MSELESDAQLEVSGWAGSSGSRAEFGAVCWSPPELGGSSAVFWMSVLELRGFQTRGAGRCGLSGIEGPRAAWNEGSGSECGLSILS